MGQTTSSISKNKIIILSLGSILALAIIGSWTMYVQELFVSITMDRSYNASLVPRTWFPFGH